MIDNLEEEGIEGPLNEAMMFFVTDSSTVEDTVDKGNTPSRALCEHVLQIKRIQFKFKLVLHITRFSGTIMICQGTYGVSRGILNQGMIRENTFVLTCH